MTADRRQHVGADLAALAGKDGSGVGLTCCIVGYVRRAIHGSAS
jgi:hypothetical protein